MIPTPRRWIPGLAAFGLFGVVGQSSGTTADDLRTFDADTVEVFAFEAPSVDETAIEIDARESALRADVRVAAFMRAYGSMIDSVTYRADDLVFSIAGQEVHFQDGRMLSASRLDRRHRCDPIFYAYPLEMQTEPAPLPDGPVRLCTDLQEALWGRTEAQIRKNARSIGFLGRRVFVNDVVAEALDAVERDVLAVAETDDEVASWIDELEVAYSFMNRRIAGTAMRSQHAFGLAIDLEPASYEGRQVYWRWTRAWTRAWHETPLEQRWSPPARVIGIFERHGFLWGGKWAHFDNIHFEYRPEIIEYNRLLDAGLE